MGRRLRSRASTALPLALALAVPQALAASACSGGDPAADDAKGPVDDAAPHGAGAPVDREASLDPWGSLDADVVPDAPLTGACHGSTSTPATRALASGDARFAVAVYGPAAGGAGPGQNLLVSPYSVSATLTMLAAGAAGETESQMQSVLALPDTPANVAPAFAELACEDESAASYGQVLALANSVWVQAGKTYEPAFLSLLSSGFGAPLQQVDFATNPSAAIASINAWVSSATDGGIPSLVGPTDLDEHARLALVDAVYFRGAWATPFDPALTSPA